jgi:hypothetical protein
MSEPFYFEHHHQVDSNLITEVMLTILKRDLSMSVAMVQGTVERDYEH